MQSVGAVRVALPLLVLVPRMVKPVRSGPHMPCALASVLVAARARNPHIPRAARDRRRTRLGLALLSLVSAVLASTPWRDGFLASICDEPRAEKTNLRVS